MAVHMGTGIPLGIYWRTAPMFETSAEPYLWMNGILAVGLGGFEEGRVRYRVFGLL